MIRPRVLGVVTGFMLAVAAWPGAQQAAYDLVIRNGRIVDGTGSPWFRADLAVRGDTIARIAPAIGEPAARVVDAAGAVVTPGFIDTHTHARRGLSQTPTAPNYVRQGVTTVLEGPDGSSPVPLAPFLKELEALAKSVNIGSFIGQGSMARSRSLAAPFPIRAATEHSCGCSACTFGRSIC